MKNWLLVAALTVGCGYTTGDDGLDGGTGSAGVAGAQAGSGGAAGQAGGAGLGGSAGSAQEAGTGGSAGSGGEGAGQGGDAGTGGSDAGSGGSAGDAGASGAPVCAEGPSPLSLCPACGGAWTMQGEETPVVFDGTEQVILRYCKDKPCSVSIKDLGGGSIGNKHTQATCEAAVNIIRAAMYGSVDAIYLDRGQTLRLTVRAGLQPGCSGAPVPVDFSLPVLAPTLAGNTIGCSANPVPTVGCPLFTEESVKVCVECLTDACDLIPQDHVRDALMAYLGNELRRQVSALVSGSCAAAGSTSPAGDACASPIN